MSDTTETFRELTHEFLDEAGRVVAGCWLRAASHWCDFKLFEASSNHEDGSVRSWRQVRSDAHCDAFDCRVMTDADPAIEGFIKWDGCIEHSVPRRHDCDGPHSVQHLQMLFQWMLAKAHEAMGADEWEPIVLP